tara:strand:+ start:609 stop:1268 length:660 start_codon:yes stop_codon:yes gene_type:complete
MCFSEEMSRNLTLMGTIVTYILYKQGKSWTVYMPVFYFTIMEFLQYLSYQALEEKKQNKKWKKLLTIIIFIHIALQPLMTNIWYSNYIPKNMTDSMNLILKLCVVVAFFMLLRLHEFVEVNDKYRCPETEPMCAKKTMIKQGIKHMKYLFRMRAPNHVVPSVFIHFFFIFIPVLFLKINPLYYLSIFLGYALTMIIGFGNEIPAIWCTFSVPTMLISLL